MREVSLECSVKSPLSVSVIVARTGTLFQRVSLWELARSNLGDFATSFSDRTPWLRPEYTLLLLGSSLP